MMIWFVLFVIIYLISLVVCRLSMIMLGENDTKIVNLVSYVPIINTVAMIIIIMLFGYIAKDNKKDKKPETAKN